MMEQLQELSQAKVRLFKSLLDKRYRARHKLFGAPGRKLLAEGLAAGHQPVAVVLSQPQAADLLAQLAAACAELNVQLPARVPRYVCPPDVLTQLADQVQPEGIWSAWNLPDDALPGDALLGTGPAASRLPGPAFVLDDIRDPGNLGTLLRTADWFGHPVLYAGPGTVDAHNPKVVRAAMGAVFRVPVRQVPNLAQFVAQHAPRIAAAVLPGHASEPHHVLPPGADLLLLGSESHGIQPDVLRTPGLRTVAIARTGQGESLNVAAAGAILAYQLATAASAPKAS